MRSRVPSSNRLPGYVSSVEEPTDIELLSAVGRRDVAALGALYDRHGQLAFNLAGRVTADRQLAEEAVQDAFFNLWRQTSQFDSARGSVRGWLLASVRNRAVDLVRQRAGRTKLDVDLDAIEYTLAADNLWDEVSTHLDRDLLRDAMAELGEEQRQALDLAYFAGMSQSEIARATGAPLGTVKSRLRLALERMRTILESKGVRTAE